MLRWLRNKLNGPVYLDCYTTDAGAYKLARPKSATHYLPNWWKRLPTTVNAPRLDNAPNVTGEVATMRHCIGFTDLFKKSFCLPLWSDLVINVEPAGKKGYVWVYADGKSNIREHPAYQWGDFLPPGQFQHLKLFSPWYFKCEEDVKFLFFDPFWPSYTGEEQVITPPGLVNYQYQGVTHVNIFVRKLPNEPHKVELEFNTPLVFITPLTERKVILRHHLVTPQEMDNIMRPQATFVDVYLKTKRAIFQTAQEAKQEQANG